MKRYESRYCTFAVPNDWETEPPFAFREKGEGPDRLGAQILERCLAEMPPITDYVREQKQILPELYEGFELLEEGPHRVEGAAGQGYFLAFRFLDDDENPSRGKSVYLTAGPLVCQLMLTGLDGPDPERDRLFEAIGKTFSFRQADFLAGAKPGALTSDTLRTPQADAARGWPSPWRKFPRVCVSLPIPSGWEVLEGDYDVLFRRGDAEIRLHRELSENDEEDIWFSNCVKRLQESGDRLLASEHGEIERGSYIAVLYQKNVTTRTWKTATSTHALEIFLQDQQPLVWTLRAPGSDLSHLCPIFELLVASPLFLDPEEWETKLPETWIDYTLMGPWKSEGKGVYAKLSEKFLILNVASEINTMPLPRVFPSIVESLRKQFDPLDNFEEVVVPGSWHQYDAFHYTSRGISESGDEICFRGIWIAKHRELITLTVQGSQQAALEGIAAGLLKGISL